jgi:hypothetical protein
MTRIVAELGVIQSVDEISRERDMVSHVVEAAIPEFASNLKPRRDILTAAADGFHSLTCFV